MLNIVRVVLVTVLLNACTVELADAASNPSTLNHEQFCQMTALQYAAPSQLARLWPDVTSTPTSTQANDMVSELITMGYGRLNMGESVAPTTKLKQGLLAVDLASIKQFAAASKLSPPLRASLSAAAVAADTTTIEKSAAAVKRFFATEGPAIVSSCRNFNATKAIDAVAVGTTNAAQLLMRSARTHTATPGILRKAASQAEHYVIFESLTGHGTHQKAHYRIAAITGMVNACTTVPSSLPPIPAAVACG